MNKGTIFGLGLGPGEPDLMSVRADRLLRQARHIAYFRKAGKPGQARQIVAGLLADKQAALEVRERAPQVLQEPVQVGAVDVDGYWHRHINQLSAEALVAFQEQLNAGRSRR